MRLAGLQVPEPRSPAPRGLGSARPGRPAGPCEAVAMARRRARGCRTLGLPAILLLLLLQPPATLGITCPDPVSVEHADIRVKSYSLHSRERYICNSGFKRKAGTSSLTECVLNKATNVAYWTTPSLKCIRDPALARQRPAPPSTVTTAGVTLQPESFSPSGKDGSTQGNSSTMVAISTSTVLLCGLSAVSLLACYIKSRQTPQPDSVEMEAMEALPVTRGTSNRDEDSENRTHNL
ncbi:interleukin-15 receptor subunit alpha isoform X2 [Cebus imitator]|uniref:interleukin-15 receptor subunit alpha isoform X2 n=1 Tax=Cebus imitator TaxID=2715852 RepID=UPI000809DE1D|nr:interleukin-15 receptor subunit alpha isoform X2 [Cebus imitator]